VFQKRHQRPRPYKVEAYYCSYLFLFRKTMLSMHLGNRREWRLSTSLPVAENRRSEAADDAGMARKRWVITAQCGYVSACSLPPPRQQVAFRSRHRTEIPIKFRRRRGLGRFTATCSRAECGGADVMLRSLGQGLVPSASPIFLRSNLGIVD